MQHRYNFKNVFGYRSIISEPSFTEYFLIIQDLFSEIGLAASKQPKECFLKAPGLVQPKLLKMISFQNTKTHFWEKNRSKMMEAATLNSILS